MSASSSNPWIVPSSPNVPCNTGKITSTCMLLFVPCAALSKGIMPCDCGTGGTITASPLASTAAPGVVWGSPARRWRALSTGGFSPRRGRSAWVAVSQWPSLVMPMGTTSYLSLSIALSTDAAESSEISCSPLRPPKRTPTLSLLIRNTLKQSALGRQQSGAVIDLQIAPKGHSDTLRLMKIQEPYDHVN